MGDAVMRLGNDLDLRILRLERQGELELTGLQPGDDDVPARRHIFELHAEGLGDRLAEVSRRADIVPSLRVLAEPGPGDRHADPELAVRLDLVDGRALAGGRNL